MFTSTYRKIHHAASGTSKLQSSGMSWLVETQPPSSRQPDRRGDSPPGLNQFGGFGALPLQAFHRRVQVIAHQVNNTARQLVIPMLLDKLAVARMNAHFRERKRKNQPAFPSIHRLEVEHVA